MHPQIFDETHPLEEVLVWGEPGIEALLGQLLPKSRSLFFSYYEVLEARREFRHLQTLVENEKIRFTRAKDALARRLDRTELAGSGHYPQYTSPAAMADAIARFLRSN